MDRDKLLEKFNLKYEDLNTAEKETLSSWVSALSTNELTLNGVKEYVVSLRDAVEQELTTFKETPDNWLSLLTLFIPMLGIIKKWYQDQHAVELRGRLRAYMLIESLLSTPEKAKKALNKALAEMIEKRA